MTSGALKNGKVSNAYDKLHRALNKQTDQVLRDLEKDLGKSVEDFDKGDWEKLGQQLERAGGDIEAFNARLSTLELEARSLGQAMAETLIEVYPAAATAGEAAAATAAETGVIP